jgi:hypothetical protein
MSLGELKVHALIMAASGAARCNYGTRERARLTQTQLARLTKKPWKVLLGAPLAIVTAQTQKIASQNMGSMFDGMTKTVATAIAKPKSESWKIS